MSNYLLDSNTNMINKNFEKIAALLPFSYGGRQYIIQGDNTKKKNKRKNLRLALKSGYTWDTHCPSPSLNTESRTIILMSTVQFRI